MLRVLLASLLLVVPQDQSGSAISRTSEATYRQEAKVVSSTSQPTCPQLPKITTVYVDSFGDDPVSNQVHSMLITALVESGRFRITENHDLADAVIKGTATEISSRNLHAASENSSLEAGSGSFGASAVGSTGTASGSASHVSTAQGSSSIDLGTNYVGRLSIRLVNASADVVWATTQETDELRDRPISSELATRAARLLARYCETGPIGMESNPSGILDANGVHAALASAKSILIRVSGDKAMETEIAKKLLGHGNLSVENSMGKADLVLEVTQTGKYDWIRGTGVTAAAELRDAENGTVLWSATKGGSWAMSGYSTRAVARQIADELLKFLEQNRKLK
jgi:hypothetical protein